MKIVKIIPLLMAPAFFLNALDIQKESGEINLGYEEWKLPKSETLGMSFIGVNFDVTPYWFAGAEIFGALRGKRGGFFAFGFNSGFHTNSKPLEFKSGLFIGAGGGGAAPQGGGLMLRPYAEIKYKTKIASLSLGASYVKFPDGDISSSQIYGAVSIPFSVNIWSGWDEIYKNGNTNDKGIKIETLMRAGEYIPSKSAKTTNNKTLENMKFMGSELRRIYNNGMLLSISSAASGGGNTDGYMELFGGLGYQLKLGNLPLSATALVELGMGGGGKVDTGGGAMWRLRAGIESTIFKHYILGVEGGYIKSFKGSFKAKTVGAYIGYKGSIFGLNKDFKASQISIRAIAKTHLTGKGDFKNPNKSSRLDMLGMAFDHYLNKNFYLTGQSFWAYKGDSGGYAEGFMGIGYKSNRWKNISLWGEALIGAGGGGGVKTSGGILLSAMLGVSYKINKKIDILAGAGYTKSTKKGLSSPDISLQFKYKFAIPSK